MYEIIGSYGTKYFVDRVEYIFYDKNGQYKNVFDFAFCTILQNEYKKYLEIDFPNEKGINETIYRISYEKEEVFNEELFSKFLENYQEFFRVFKDYRNYNRAWHTITECYIKKESYIRHK